MDHEPSDLGGWEDRHARAIRVVQGGKRFGDAIYLHQSLLSHQALTLQSLVGDAARSADIPATAFNVVRISTRRPEVAFLDYPDFFEQAFPVLRHSWFVRLPTAQVVDSDFSTQDNPPILHRKELLLPGTHPERPRFELLTVALEDRQAFDFAPHLIGRRQYWHDTLCALGLRVEDHELIEVDVPAPADHRPGVAIARHRTAISRSRLSAPMQLLARWGFLDGSHTVLDYGCGRGDDVSALVAAGIDAAGWDPHFAPEAQLAEADIVNLGFVLNVIEAANERADALQTAYRLARHVLCVAVMLNRNGAEPTHADGVITRRGTFQHYFSQTELREYVARVLERVAP